MLSSFGIPGRLKIRNVPFSHRNHTGLDCGWPSAVTVVSQAMMSVRSRSAAAACSLSFGSRTMPITIPVRGSAAESGDELAGVEVLPPLVRRGRRVVPVQLDKQVDQVAPDRSGPQEDRELGESEQPVRVPGGPVLVDAVGDPVDGVVGLGGFV